MSIVIFAGPTIERPAAERALDATYLPPVSEGDVYRATLDRPRCIGIIDGYFENVPAVWHKEILHALRQGIHVFGSASMGALRAAELAPFGMEGAGAIFQAYLDGHLEDDDEVAVIHGPAELGYPQLSEAMVNIRRTLSDALAEGVIDNPCREQLESLAKDLPYPERRYATVLKQGYETGLAGAALRRLKAWLPDGRVDQKREDALAMLHTIRRRAAAGWVAKSVDFHFEHTTLWRQAVARAAA